MYIQLTTICNMFCEHCCFSCTNLGVNMPLNIFRKACDYANSYGSNIFLGGGEPTLHPQFEQFLGIALLHNDNECPVGVITNGTNTKITMGLLNAAHHERLYCFLSLDNFHDSSMVNPGVIAYAEKYKLIRRIDEPYAQGRAENYGRKGCACSDLFIDPYGDVYPCGCKITKLGNICDPNFSIDSEYMCNECERDIMFVEEREENECSV